MNNIRLTHGNRVVDDQRIWRLVPERKRAPGRNISRSCLIRPIVQIDLLTGELSGRNKVEEMQAAIKK